MGSLLEADWGSRCRAETHSAATIGEIQSGIEITREHDRSKAAEIEVWLEQISETYNVLSIDARIFRCWRASCVAGSIVSLKMP
jgi:hypothetical protein